MKYKILFLTIALCRSEPQIFSDLARLTGTRTGRQQSGVDLDTSSDSPTAAPPSTRPRIVNRPPTNTNPVNVENSIAIVGTAAPGPQPLSFCQPLTRPDCGLLADLNLTSGLLQFIEEGNIKTTALNSFLDSRLVSSLSSLSSQTEVPVYPDDLQLSGAVPYISILGGRGCSNRAKLQGGSVTGRLRGESDLLTPGSNLFKRKPVFFQGVVSGDLDIAAKVQATFFKNILISCLRKRDALNHIKTSVGGTAALGVRMAASNFKLDYVSDAVAEISFDFGLSLQARLFGLDTGITSLPGCSFEGIPRLSVCQELGSILSAELKKLTRDPFRLSSPNLLSRVERLMGARQGDRIKLVIFRAPRQTQGASGQTDLSGFGRSLPKRPVIADAGLEPELGIDVPAKLRRRPRVGRSHQFASRL